jgi:LCP family protein required for cell wall assembly
MSSTNQTGSPDLAGAPFEGDAPPGRPARRKRRGRRIALISTGSVFALIVVVAVGAYATANHFASSVHRIPGVFTQLDAARRPALPAATATSMTILLTGSGPFSGPQQGHGTDGASTAAEAPSGLYALVHFDADRKAASVVNIPSNTVVNVPGHGRSQLQNVLTYGGPALLIDTIQKFTNVPIDHYAVVNFGALPSALKPLGGADVYLPAATTSDGFAFHAGVNHLSSANVLAYVRQASLTQEERTLRQQAILRAILQKLVHENLISDPLRDLSLLDAFTSVLSVDSDFSNSQLYHLAGDLHLLRAGSSTFVTAPVTASAVNGVPVQLVSPLDSQLWQALRTDSVAAFAAKHPATMTPNAPN